MMVETRHLILDNERLRAENARLKARQDEVALAWTKLTDSQEGEIDRLRAALEEMARLADEEMAWHFAKRARAALNEETK